MSPALEQRGRPLPASSMKTSSKIVDPHPAQVNVAGVDMPAG